MTAPVMEFDQVTKVVGGAKLVDRISLSLVPGKVYGLLGPNGAGKTTLLKLGAGLLRPTEGHVWVQGEPVVPGGYRHLKALGILIETPVFYEGWSSWDNLRFHLMAHRAPGIPIGPVLERVGLDPDRKDPVAQWSLGMRQRLALARALVHRPKVLLLDEPVNGLDPWGLAQMRQLFLELAQEEGMALLVSSHILAEVEQVADVVGLIQGGRLIREQALSDAVSGRVRGLESWYFEAARPQEVHHGSTHALGV